MDTVAPQAKVLEIVTTRCPEVDVLKSEAHKWRFNLNNSLTLIYIYKSCVKFVIYVTVRIYTWVIYDVHPKNIGKLIVV